MTREEASYILRKFYADGYKSNNYNTLEQALQLAVMCLESFPCWISVEDELPPKESEYEDNSIVVLATDGYGVYKGLYRCSEYLSGWFTCDLWALENITHWMPLPQAPKIGGEQ